MTGEEIVGLSTEQLESMTDDQLEAFFAPLFAITRPAVVLTTEENNKPKRKSKEEKNAEAELFQKLLEEALSKKL